MWFARRLIARSVGWDGHYNSVWNGTDFKAVIPYYFLYISLKLQEIMSTPHYL